MAFVIITIIIGLLDNYASENSQTVFAYCYTRIACTIYVATKRDGGFITSDVVIRNVISKLSIGFRRH